MEKKQTSRSGVGFFGVLTAVFVGLKLAKVIDWSWFWVLSPTIIPWSIAIIIVSISVVIATIMRFREGK